MLRLLALLLVLAATLPAQKRVLLVTHSAGFRHDSIRFCIQALSDIGRRSGKFLVTATEDVSQISSANLAQFDAVFFFTSGELPLSDVQKRDLLDFVRRGKGFGGAHSATDTLYTWPEYGDLIGGYFDGHPWVHEATVDVEDPDFPGFRALGPNFRMVEEYYQFRAWSRDRVRVLLTLNPESIDLTLEGVNRTDRDFALAWIREYGQGRVFYTALGHFDETWLDPRFQVVLENAVLWLLREVEADASPRSASAMPAPRIGGIATPAGPAEGYAPGSVVAIYGEGLTSGSTLEAASVPLPGRLAGTRVEIGGRLLPLYFVSPGQVNAQLPFDLTAGTAANLSVASVNRVSGTQPIRIVPVAPALAAGTATGGILVIYGTGWGALETTPQAGDAAPAGSLNRITQPATAFVNNVRGSVRFAGLAPALVGVYQMNVEVPAGVSAPFDVYIEIGGQGSNHLTIR